MSARLKVRDYSEVKTADWINIREVEEHYKLADSTVETHAAKLEDVRRRRSTVTGCWEYKRTDIMKLAGEIHSRRKDPSIEVSKDIWSSDKQGPAVEEIKQPEFMRLFDLPEEEIPVNQTVEPSKQKCSRKHPEAILNENGLTLWDEHAFTLEDIRKAYQDGILEGLRMAREVREEALKK